jgi:uncharacterized membrane protein YkvI
MQAVFLMVTYVLTAIGFQVAGFGVSRVIEYQYPTAGLTAFLLMFLLALVVAWPIAIVIAEWAIQKAGFTLSDRIAPSRTN